LASEIAPVAKDAVSGLVSFLRDALARLNTDLRALKIAENMMILTPFLAVYNEWAS
jgi:hypothetical protein